MYHSLQDPIHLGAWVRIYNPGHWGNGMMGKIMEIDSFLDSSIPWGGAEVMLEIPHRDFGFVLRTRMWFNSSMIRYCHG